MHTEYSFIRDEYDLVGHQLGTPTRMRIAFRNKNRAMNHVCSVTSLFASSRSRSRELAMMTFDIPDKRRDLRQIEAVTPDGFLSNLVLHAQWNNVNHDMMLNMACHVPMEGCIGYLAAKTRVLLTQLRMLYRLFRATLRDGHDTNPFELSDSRYRLPAIASNNTYCTVYQTTFDYLWGT
jgi:hypothetical protein